jgi:hypothetical protein
LSILGSNSLSVFSFESHIVESVLDFVFVLKVRSSSSSVFEVNIVERAFEPLLRV